MTDNTIQSRDVIAAREIYADSTVDDGGTWSLDGKPATSGVAVTVKVLATIFGPLTQEPIRAAIEQIRQTAGKFADTAHIGTWYDAENECWEISQTTVFESRETARIFGGLLNERYVYDIDTQECIAVR